MIYKEQFLDLRMRSIMKGSNEKGTIPEKRLSISPILTYYHYNNGNDNGNDNDNEIKNDKEDLIKIKKHLKRQMPKLNSKNDMDFEYY